MFIYEQPRAAVALAVAAGLGVAPLGVAAPAEPPKVDFARDVQPLFENACWKCHGPEKKKGQLRLDGRATAMKGGVSGPVIVPGDAAGSLLFKLLRSSDPDERMPRKADPLSPAQIDVLRRWIDQGAVWPEALAGAVAVPDRHWSYVKPVRPALPGVSRPAWVRNPIDTFVLARLDREGLAPSTPARRETLIRRVSLDLTGLPPTPAEVDAFVADRSPNAYESVVDRLLASPHHGERWAQPWLDQARYADSNGFRDGPRSMWRYRDWVIGALNDDMPFDRFTIEQIAGDMLPEATVEQRIASGFHANTMLNEEDGVDADEQRYYVLVDRVNTTGAVWLGTTVACAQCHNHKYDPFSQKDYFSLLAFFDNGVTVRRNLGGNGGVLKDPTLTVGPATTVVMQEKASFERPSTPIRVRGSFTNPGARVYANVPTALLPLSETQPANRLGLARWLVDKENPLTARVTVNRLWEQYFGTGLVETSEDFGLQGSRPTHPELLDWLATELVARGWSLKALHRLIVTSATYRQSSQVTPALLEKDPANRLLARGPRFRASAETIRDVLLASSGLLCRKMGGPSVFPPQPEGAAVERDSRWATSAGEDRYRRSVYTFWRRAAPYAMFATFDATSREVCTLRRVRTNTPLQALNLLNDPALFEAARALARRMVTGGGSTPRGRATHGFRLCLARRPRPDELEILLGLYRNHLERFSRQGGADEVLAGYSPPAAPHATRNELGAWTLVAHVLLNLDETQTKE